MESNKQNLHFRLNAALCSEGEWQVGNAAHTLAAFDKRGLECISHKIGYLRGETKCSSGSLISVP